MEAPPPTARLPLWLKLAFTAYMAVLVPFYIYSYGPTNFFYFCDVALFLTLIALWTEHPLPAGMALVGIFIPQTIWLVDFTGGLLGHPPLDVTAYMFKSSITLFARGLSLFHGWLPYLLLFLLLRLGYDRRSLAAWVALAWAVLFICYFFLPAPPPPDNNPNIPVNVNYVYGITDDKPQEWLPPTAWFILVLIAFPLLIYTPTHFFLRSICPVYRRPGTLLGAWTDVERQTFALSPSSDEKQPDSHVQPSENGLAGEVG